MYLALSGGACVTFWSPLGRAAGYPGGVSPKKTRLINRIPAIELSPVVENGSLAAKATAGEPFPIRATVFKEGHDAYCAEAVLIDPAGKEHSRTRMYGIASGLDRLEAWVMADRQGDWSFRVDTWADPWETWKHEAEIKIPAGIDVELVCEEGARLLERCARGANLAAARPPRSPALPKSKMPADSASQLEQMAGALRDSATPPEVRLAAATSPRIEAIFAAHPLRDLAEATEKFPLQVDRRAALYGAWYEIFPRSAKAAQNPDGSWISGTLKTAAEDLERIRDMGFDVVYLTPIHPIGQAYRKGKNNSLTATETDPGSPWAIGSKDGGHDAIHPDLGEFADFDAFVARAGELGMEVALDLALQCSPDHPWVTQHPEWFSQRADGSIAYAENLPKKYQDIYPLNFDNDPAGLFEAIVQVTELWINHGVRIFRVDNPHTKPVNFWQCYMEYMHQHHPDVVFLAEAFTRPAMMRTLGQVGFHQSYCYFAWRQTKQEIEDYFQEVAADTAHLMRPSFWPITPDILTEQMTTGGVAIFALRAILAATGAPTWGCYSGYELCENVQRPGFEEPNDNEKYEYRPRDWKLADQLGIADLIRTLNRARAEHPALQQLHQISVHPTSSDQLVCFSKHVPARFSPTGKADTVVVVVSLDPHNQVEGSVWLNPYGLIAPDGRAGTQPVDLPERDVDLVMVDALDGRRYRWSKEGFVKLSPWTRMGHVFWVESGLDD